MRTSLARTATASLLAVGALAGCSEDQTSDAAPREEPVVVEIRIQDGEVTPRGEQVDATVGQAIELRVDSDAADEIHVHSEPEEEFEIEADPGTEQVFEFTVEVPGQVEIELHEAGETILELVVQP